MKNKYNRSLFYLLMALVCQFAALATFLNDHLLYAVALAVTGTWLVVLSVAAFWYIRMPDDLSATVRLYLGDTTIVVFGLLALGIVGFETQGQASFLPLYLSLMAYWIYKRHQPGYKAWEALAT